MNFMTINEIREERFNKAIEMLAEYLYAEGYIELSEEDNDCVVLRETGEELVYNAICEYIEKTSYMNDLKGLNDEY